MTKADILAQLYERLNYQTSPSSVVSTRLGNMVNEVYRDICRTAGLGTVRDTVAGLTFASVAGQAFYGLPPALTNVKAITDRTNDRPLLPLSLLALRMSDPGLDLTGTPTHFVRLGMRPVKTLPSATGLWVASADNADNTQTIQINGIRSGGVESLDQSVQLAGTTRTAIGSFTDYVDVLMVQLSAVAAGVVSIFDASSSGNTLAQISIGAKTVQYLGVQLYPTPTSAVTYYVDGPVRLPELDDTTDVPLLPEEFHDMLVDGVLIREYQVKDDGNRLAATTALFTRKMSQLKYATAAPPSDIPVMGGQQVRTSRLGGMYPAD